ncbi:MAG TPA: hypothetical protein VK447_01800 [Myxococcaceae bacterium]|nr:hypothetical protein [Myxococcaceae bacterium]
MVKTAPPPRFRWALCLVALSASLASAQGTGRVFIQGSEVNLRALANANGEVVKKLPIGTECTRLGYSKEWVRLECGGATGFTLKSLIGAEKPTFDALFAKAQDAKAKVKDRFEAATRAAALDPKNEKALDLLAELFFEVNFEQLDKDSSKGGLHEAVTIKRKMDHDLGRQRNVEESFIWELEKIEYDWHQLRLRDGDFVSAMYREGSLVVYTGYISPSAGKGRYGKTLDTFTFNVESRTSSAASESLRLALQRGARVPDPARQKYDVLEAEYAGMPALKPDAYKLFRSLPQRWHLLSGTKGDRYVDGTCNLFNGIELLTDIHRRAVLYAGTFNDPSGNSPAAFRVAEVTKTGASYSLRIQGEKTPPWALTVTWPTEEPNVARWKGDRTSLFDGDHAVAGARNIRVRDDGCNREQ